MAERYSEREGRRWDDERRERGEWGYGSRAGDYSRDYRGQERHGDDRGFFDRAGDEVRSWFGDEEAQRRRMRDEREDYGGERRDWGSRESYRGRGDWGQDMDPRQWSRQWGYVEGRGSGTGERGRDWGRSGSDWTRGGSSDRSRGWGSESGRGSAGWGRSGQGYYGGYGAYGRERDWGGEGDWGGQGPSGFGVYRGTLSEQRESGGPWRGDREQDREQWGSGPYAGRGPRNYQRSDERIREEVCERLAHHPRIDATDVDIRVQNGEVTLQGHVNDRWAKRWAEDVAEGIWGVKEVHNQIRVSQSGLLGQESHEGQQGQQEGQRPQQQQQQRGPWAA